MKIVVIGGTGLIGSQLVQILRQRGHEVVAASPSGGINAVTGEGLAAALSGAEVVVDVANSPSFEDRAVLDFFRSSSRNLLAAEKAAGVKHHVALSIVGTERLLDSGYFRAKRVQEELIEQGDVPYTILRATQFFEFMGGIAHTSVDGAGAIRLSSALMQPIASGDVAAALADVALASPLNGMAEVAGPERQPMSDFVSRHLGAQQDKRPVVVDRTAPYFGVVLTDASLVPAETGARIMPTRYDAWLAQQPAKTA